VFARWPARAAAIGGRPSLGAGHDGARPHADAALVFYLNFKWVLASPSPPRRALEHEVRERDYFFVASFAAWRLGRHRLAALMEAPLARRRWALPRRAARRPDPLLGNRLMASRAGETMRGDYARDVPGVVDPYALIITTGTTHFPAVARPGSGRHPEDVSVVVLSLARTNCNLSQLERRPAQPFDPRPRRRCGAPCVAPANRCLDEPLYLTGGVGRGGHRHLAALRGLSEPSRARSARSRSRSIRRAGRPYLDRGELAVLQIIKDQLGKRPIYFSTSTGTSATSWACRPIS